MRGGRSLIDLEELAPPVDPEEVKVDRLVWVGVTNAMVYHDNEECGRVNRQRKRIPTLEPWAVRAGIELCKSCLNRRSW